MSRQADELVQQAVAAFQQGTLERARQACEQAIRLNSRHFDAWHVLGVVQGMAGEPAQASRSLGRAVELDPRHPFARFNLAKSLSDLGRDDEALEHHRQSAALMPANPEAWLNLGQCLSRLGQLSEAIECCDRALVHVPEYVLALNAKGALLHEAGRHGEALASFDKSLQIHPSDLEICLQRAKVLGAMGRHDEAMGILCGLRRHEGIREQAWAECAIQWLSVGRRDQALACLDQVLVLNPQSASALTNKGLLLCESDQPVQGLEFLEQAVRSDPQDAVAQRNLGCQLLASGEFARGWPAYEWRWKAGRTALPQVAHFKPVWQGQTCATGRLLIWGEQGPGDQVLHASMLQDVRHLKPMVCVDARLIRGFQRAFPELEFMPRDASLPLDAFDFQIAMASLGRYCRSGADAFPLRPQAWIAGDPRRTQTLRERLHPDGGKLLCGVSWRSRDNDFADAKSMRLEQLLTGWDACAHGVVDLQYGDTREERSWVGQSLGLDVLKCEDIDNMADLDALLSLIQACDAVVTISNTTAHLAGALGVPTWLLLPSGKGRHWYWQQRGDASLWYPGVRILVQDQPGDWAGVVRRLADQLRQMR